MPKSKNKTAKKATKAAKAAGQNGKPVWAGSQTLGDPKVVGKVPVPRHLASKVGKPDGETFGKTTGLRIVHAVDAMFRHNERVKTTDANLRAWLVRVEFPRRHTAESGVKGQKTVQTVAAYRAYHNAGKHGCDGGLGDGHQSSSYSSEGVARVRPTTKPKPKAKAKAKAKAKK